MCDPQTLRNQFFLVEAQLIHVKRAGSCFRSRWICVFSVGLGWVELGFGVPNGVSARFCVGCHRRCGWLTRRTKRTEPESVAEVYSSSSLPEIRSRSAAVAYKFNWAPHLGSYFYAIISYCSVYSCLKLSIIFSELLVSDCIIFVCWGKYLNNRWIFSRDLFISSVFWFCYSRKYFDFIHILFHWLG